MSAALSFGHAFSAVNEAPVAWQPLLRSVLLSAMQDSALQELLQQRSLWPELWAVGALLLGPASPRSKGSRRARISLVPAAAPSNEISTLLESARRLEAPERALDEALLARLLTLALADAAFLQHLQSGKDADDFLAESQVRPRRRSSVRR
ncbi:MAG TPA: hypothetical protein VMF89_20945 [Polyangiales bacterium]|nr:hypothetical protein [Polyangiales bacterium]